MKFNPLFVGRATQVSHPDVLILGQFLGRPGPTLSGNIKRRRRSFDPYGRGHRKPGTGKIACGKKN
jgi:hypothetical protein